MSQIPTVKLNNGAEVPILGLGTWKSKPGEVFQAVKDAIDVGYRHIDCALIYANEKEIGGALKEKIQEGIVKREDLFLTSKLWSTCHRPDLVVPALKQTLSDLGVDSVDLYLMHWPMAFQEGDSLFPKDDAGNWIFSDVDYVNTWKAMEECVSLGLTKAIGLSNFNSEQINRILDICKIKPVMNQVECNPYLNQKKLLELCKSKDIQITGYSPFWSPDRVWAKKTDPKLLEEPKLAELGEKYGKSPAQIVLRWQIQRGIIVIPKSVTKERIAQNFDVFGFALSEDDMNIIYGMDCNRRALAVEWYKGSKHYPFNIEF